MSMSTPAKFKGVAPRLRVADLQRTIVFYTQTLGFSVCVRWPDDHPAFCMVERDGVCLGFHLAESAGDLSTGRLCELYIEVEDVRALHAVLRERLRIEWGPEVYHYRRGEFACLDPDGYMLIFTEPTEDSPTCLDA